MTTVDGGARRGALGLAVAGCAVWTACASPPPAPEAVGPAADARLAAHSAEFEPRVYEVTDGVHVAVGFGLANAILLEGDDGVVVVDTMESREAAAAVKAAFDRITRKPLRAIVYTHNHADHIFGAGAFTEGRPVPVYAHVTTNHHIDRVVSVIRPAIYRRAMAMFGNYLPDGAVLNAGIGPALRSGHGGGTPALVRPTHTFTDALDLEIAGLRLRLVHAPGETDDQLFVWLPDARVLLSGDNFYKSFPNLYTIRGTPYRDPLQWVASLDAMRALRPAHLVPSHTRPLSGEAAIATALRDYRDAIQFVHDQTVRGINRGLAPDELVAAVRLPAHLAASPYLQEFYGTVEWSVRGIFVGYLGWFDGNAATLSPLAADERAHRLAALAGGGDRLVAEGRRALGADDLRWAAEVADAALRLDPDGEPARTLVADVMQRLGERHPSANGRHYYLTRALELRRREAWPGQDLAAISTAFMETLPIAGFLRAMTVNLNPERSADVDQVLRFRFPDVGESWTMHVRRGVADLHPATAGEEAAITIVTDSTVWKEILLRRRSPLVAYVTGAVTVEGGTLDLVRFLGLFDRV